MAYLQKKLKFLQQGSELRKSTINYAIND